MSKAEELIKQIEEADEIEILEFDFDPCFAYMREMESALKEITARFQEKLDLHKQDCFAYQVAKKALDEAV
ncbi:hypothetical protein [Endozoicomonas sp. ALD040]|uniref:hypothetical protein n=1 Tax=Endozoicomonas sp. ALD040 TaxID=3403079 RepID=UPI003BB20657